MHDPEGNEFCTAAKSFTGFDLSNRPEDLANRVPSGACDAVSAGEPETVTFRTTRRELLRR